jgi:dihydrolipoamide dehydrogenase
MKHKTIDVAIVGHGSAGSRAYKAAKKHTESVVIIEGGEYGTTCARNGCMPSKLLIAGANAAKTIREASLFGIQTENVEISGKKVMERVRTLRDDFVSRVLGHVEKIPEQDRIQGIATFQDNNTLIIDEKLKITAKSIVIATGSRPRLLPGFEALGDRGITNEDVFEWEDLPGSVAIFGTGVIGMELGQALDRLGVRTAIFGRSGNVGAFSDPDIQETANNLYHGELEVFPGADVHSMKREKNKVRIRFTTMYGIELEERFDYVLSAIGRIPNVDHLGLKNTDVPMNTRGMPVFDAETLQCGNTNIFIAGDANGYLSLLHEAADEGEIAGANAALFPKVQKGHRRVPIGVVFTEPEMAVVGKMYRELPKDSFVTGSVDFLFQPRSEIMAKNRGKLNLYIDKKSKKLLGAEMIGPRVEHIAHLLSWSIGFGAKLDELLEMPFYHPTVEEAIRNALNDARKKLEKGE